jgi:hypothetical protein
MYDLDAEEFASRLASGDLPDPSQLTVVGLARTIEDSASVIGFTRSPNCQHWLSLPTDVVSSIRHLANMRCAEHEHPVVELTFKPPSKERPDLAFLLRLCSQLQNSISQFHRHLQQQGASTQASEARRPSQGSKPQPRQAECYYVQSDYGLQVCCYTENGGLELSCTGMV